MTNIVKSFDGKNFYPYLVIKRTAKTATVQACDVDGKPRNNPITKRINTTGGSPAIKLNRFEEVYLDQSFSELS